MTRTTRARPARPRSAAQEPPDTVASPPSAGFDRRASLALGALMALYAGVYSFICITKYRYYLYTDFDLAIFSQAVDGILRGSMFSSIRGMNWLGDHSSLILFLIAPLYALFRHPVTLLVLQSAVLALGALPVAWLARRELGNAWLAVGCAALYLLYPALGYSNLFEFHPETLATTTLLFAFDALRTGRTRALILWSALSLLAKEDVALVIGAMALYAPLQRSDPRRFRHATALAAMAAVSLLVTFVFLKPMNAGEAQYGDMYKQWGPNARVAILTMLRRPNLVVAQLFHSVGSTYDSTVKREYWIHLLLPLGFLPLLAPLELLIAAPILAEHLLSWRPEQHSIVFQYTALITPFCVVAAVIGLARLGRWLAPRKSSRGSQRGRSATPAHAPPAAPRAAWVLAAIGSLASNAIFGPLVTHAGPPGSAWLQTLTPHEHNAPDGFERALQPIRDRMLGRVPTQGAVVASLELLSHLGRHAEIHSLHHVLLGTYTFSTRPYPIPRGVTALVANAGAGGTGFATLESGARMRELLQTNGLVATESAGEMALYLHGARPAVETPSVTSRMPEIPRRVRYDDAIEYLGCDPPQAALAPGQELAFATYWRRVAPIDRIYSVAIQLASPTGPPVTTLPRDLGQMSFPARDWPPDSTVRDVLRWILPVGMPPGRYGLSFGVGWRTSPQKIGMAAPADSAVRANGGVVTVGEVVVGRPRADR